MNSSSQHPILLVVLAFFVLTSTLLAATGDTLSVGNSAGLPGMAGYTIPVNLRNVTTLKGLLFKIKDLPDSLTVTNVAVTGRASGFQVQSTAVGGTIKILMYPTNGSTPLLTAGNGADSGCHRECTTWDLSETRRLSVSTTGSARQEPTHTSLWWHEDLQKSSSEPVHWG